MRAHDSDSEEAKVLRDQIISNIEFLHPGEHYQLLTSIETDSFHQKFAMAVVAKNVNGVNVWKYHTKHVGMTSEPSAMPMALVEMYQCLLELLSNEVSKILRETTSGIANTPKPSWSIGFVAQTNGVINNT